MCYDSSPMWSTNMKARLFEKFLIQGVPTLIESICTHQDIHFGSWHSLCPLHIYLSMSIHHLRFSTMRSYELYLLITLIWDIYQNHAMSLSCCVWIMRVSTLSYCKLSYLHKQRWAYQYHDSRRTHMHSLVKLAKCMPLICIWKWSWAMQ